MHARTSVPLFLLYSLTSPPITLNQLVTHLLIHTPDRISATMMSRAMLNMRKSVHRPQSNTDISSSDDTDTLKWDSFFVHANAGGTSVDGTTMSGNGGEDLIEVDENEVSVDLDLGFNGANRVGSDDDDYNGEMRSVEGENRDGGLDIASAV